MPQAKDAQSCALAPLGTALCKLRMINKLIVEYNLDIVKPFNINIEGKAHNFDCLIKEYGSENGMVIDKDYSKILPVKDKLLELGYGFSCFNIYEASSDFGEVLNDWGKFA